MSTQNRHFVPVRSCCGLRHLGVECPDGLVMCCLCFDRVTKDRLAIDASGAMVDVCIPCDAADHDPDFSREDE